MYFFKHIFCFRSIGRMLLEKIMNKFKKERIQGSKTLFEQGKEAKKIYLVFDGDFEVTRTK